MVRTAKVDESDKAGGKVLEDKTAKGSNEFSEQICKGFVADYEGEQAEIDEILEAARVACQPHIDRQKEIAKEAAECGIEKKAFKTKLRERSLERKAENCRATLSDRQREVFDRMSGFLIDDLFAYGAKKAEEEDAKH